MGHDDRDLPADSAPVRPGDVLAGKWRIERVLGTGGMGVVVAAVHLQLDQRVAIKFLLPEARDNAEVMARFGREARAAARLSGPHVARVLDVGELEGGAPYMVMEYLEGIDLARALRERGPLPVREAVDHVLDACDALAEAHAAGIVHRDVKPANMFLARQPDGTSVVKVIDFGISKVEGIDGGLTRTRAVMGSPLYMSPEQLAATRGADARSDVWSLGATLYELLTGAPPFRGETMAHLVAAVLHRDPPAPSASRPEVPRELDAIVRRCLKKSPADRFSGVAALATALVPFGGERASMIASRATRVSESMRATMLATARDGDEGASRGSGERSWSATGARTTLGRGVFRGLAALVAGVALAGVAILALRAQRPAQSAASVGVDAMQAVARAPSLEPAAEPIVRSHADDAPREAADAGAPVSRADAAAPDGPPEATRPKGHGAPSEHRNPLRPQLK